MGIQVKKLKENRDRRDKNKRQNKKYLPWVLPPTAHTSHPYLIIPIELGLASY